MSRLDTTPARSQSGRPGMLQTLQKPGKQEVTIGDGGGPSRGLPGVRRGRPAVHAESTHRTPNPTTYATTSVWVGCNAPPTGLVSSTRQAQPVGGRWLAAYQAQYAAYCHAPQASMLVATNLASTNLETHEMVSVNYGLLTSQLASPAGRMDGSISRHARRGVVVLCAVWSCGPVCLCGAACVVLCAVVLSHLAPHVRVYASTLGSSVRAPTRHNELSCVSVKTCTLLLAIL